MVLYKHQVVKLTKRQEANGFLNVITSVTIHYIASENGKEAIARCTLDFDIPENNKDFVQYSDVNPLMIIEWSKKRIDYSKFHIDLEKQLKEFTNVEEVIF